MRYTFSRFSKCLKYIKGLFFSNPDTIRIRKIEEVTSEVQKIFELLTDLMNTPEFNRFDVYDYYTKKTKLHSVIALINSVSTRYKTNNLERNIIIDYLREIKYNNISYDKIIMVLNECISQSLNNQKIFIVLRNTIAQEWIRRNIMESVFRPRDLNVLNYSFDDYLRHLENCKYMIIYDIEKFINRYGSNHSKYILVEADIRKSINDLIYKEVRFNSIENEIKKLKRKKPTITTIITLRGWFRPDPKLENIDIFKVLDYTPYEKSI